MKLAKELGRHGRPMMLVVPLGMLGIVPGLTLSIFALGLVFIFSWIASELVERAGVAQTGANATGALGGSPTRW